MNSTQDDMGIASMPGYAPTLDELPITPTRSRYAVFLTDSSTH